MSGIPRKKPCTQCGRNLSLKEFGRVSKARLTEYNKRGWNTYLSECKWCVRQRVLVYTLKNRGIVLERFRTYGKMKNAIIKDIVFQAYGGYKCACCSETNKLFLSLDHIENDGADWRRGIFGDRNAAGSTTYRWLLKNGCPAGFQILCMNCNHGKRMNKGVCPHQVRCNDYPVMGVESSDSKRIALRTKLLGEDIVSSALKNAAAVSAGLLYIN